MTDAAGRAPDLLPAADRALVRTVDGLDPEAYSAPSLLPGWTRAHVLAHVTLNAEALAGVLHGARVGRTQPMYASQEARDGDIEELAGVDPAELRDRFLASTATFGEALAAMHEGDWEGTFDRTPGARTTRIAHVPLMRVREVEVHHADLGTDYSAADWPLDFCGLLLDSLGSVQSASFAVRPTDLDGTWRFGQDGAGPVVSGTAGALGWWLTGRGDGAGLTSDTGDLPEVEAW